jgi:hypothetical protein
VGFTLAVLTENFGFNSRYIFLTLIFFCMFCVLRLMFLVDALEYNDTCKVEHCISFHFRSSGLRSRIQIPVVSRSFCDEQLHLLTSHGCVYILLSDRTGRHTFTVTIIIIIIIIIIILLLSLLLGHMPFLMDYPQ